jgi:hypothetical protein
MYSNIKVENLDYDLFILNAHLTVKILLFLIPYLLELPCPHIGKDAFQKVCAECCTASTEHVQ